MKHAFHRLTVALSLLALASTSAAVPTTVAVNDTTLGQPRTERVEIDIYHEGPFLLYRARHLPPETRASVLMTNETTGSSKMEGPLLTDALGRLQRRAVDTGDEIEIGHMVSVTIYDHDTGEPLGFFKKLIRKIVKIVVEVIKKGICAYLTGIFGVPLC